MIRKKISRINAISRLDIETFISLLIKQNVQRGICDVRNKKENTIQDKDGDIGNFDFAFLVFSSTSKTRC